MVEFMVYKCPKCEREFETKHGFSIHTRVCIDGKHGNTFGCHTSEETRRKISASNLGEKHTNYGKHLSEETKRRIGESQKGEKHWAYGKHFSDETKQKMSEATGHTSVETRKKISDSSRGKVLSEWHKQRIREGWVERDIKGNYTDSGPELRAQAILTHYGIMFTKQANLPGRPDIYLDEYKICVFVDGEYFHSKPGRKEHDEDVTYKLGLAGYKVFRISDQELLNNPYICMQNVLDEVTKIQCQRL